MNTSTKIAALAPVGIALVGLTQLHYVISHFATIAEVAAAVTVGAAIWTGKSIMGKRKAAAADEAQPIGEQAQAYLLGMRAAVQQLGQAAPVQATSERVSQAVTKR